ncbi:MAG: hypothetical protein HFE64_01175 [Lachnospiraceae bacterium]|jgi:predicted phosphodiesterase|nr:hypothetical protein [Lachnospiraceae bacterium]
MKNHMQTIGIISDIHGNYPALEAILEHMAHEQVDTLYFLGDYITDGPEPQRTLALLRQAAQHFSVLFIRGNREQYLIDHANHPEQVWKPGPAQGALLYTYQRLTAQDLDWFRSMPICHSLKDVILCHGSPSRVNELLNVDGTNSTADETTAKWLRQIQKPLLICGHTHRQGISRANGRTILGAGSAGLPHNHDCLARAALLHQNEAADWQIQLLSIPYDVDAILRAYHHSELMEMAPGWSHANCRFLATGHNYILKLLKRTRLLAAAQHPGMDLALPEIPQAIWLQAAADLGLFSE